MESNGTIAAKSTAAETHERILRRTGRIVEQSKQLATLNAIASAVSQLLDYQHALNSAVEQVPHLMDFDAGLVFLTDKSSGELRLKAHHGLSQRLVDLIGRLIPPEEFIGPVITSGEPLLGEIPRRDSGALSKHLRREGFWFFVAIPLKAKGNTLGVMVLPSHGPRHVDLDSGQFLSSVGDVIGVAIENASLYEDIAKLLEETKLQAAKLMESERQFRTVIESATDAMAIIQDGRFQYVNAYGLEMLGYPSKEIGDLRFLDVVHADDREAVARNNLGRLQGDVVPPRDMAMVRKDGTVLPVSLNACVIEYDRRPAILAIARDMTESKLLREQVLQSEKMSALGQLISGVAHELNNPLTAIIGYSELLRLEPNLPEPLLSGLEFVHEAAQRAGRIVQNLLTVARRHPGTKSLVDINELLERTLALRAYEQNVNNIEVMKDLTSGLPRTVADASQLQQVFLNLIINAEQAMLEAHGRGRLDVQSRELSSSGQRKPDHAGRIIEIVIADNGPGIPQTNLNRIFEPFFTTKKVGQGTGLGLSISHSIIQDHGGRLSARTRPGNGATFIIELPVLKETVVTVQQAPELPPRRCVTAKNVLIIDDEPAIVNLLQKIVVGEGHRVDTAANGAQALTRLGQQPYDLILCDMKMPHLGGKELYQEVKRHNESLTQKVVFVTGDVVGDDTQAFLERTGARFIEKPFVFDEVIRVIRSVLTDDGVMGA